MKTYISPASNWRAFAIANKHGDYFRVFVVYRDLISRRLLHRLSLAEVGDDIAVARSLFPRHSECFLSLSLCLFQNLRMLNRTPNMITWREMTSEPATRGGLTPEIVRYHARERAAHNYATERRVTTYGHGFQKIMLAVVRSTGLTILLRPFCFARSMQAVRKWLPSRPRIKLKGDADSSAERLRISWRTRVPYRLNKARGVEGLSSFSFA